MTCTFGDSKPQHVDDVVTYLRRGGGGQCDRCRRAERLSYLGESHVFRTKIVSPEAEAVGFVDHEQFRSQLRQKTLKRRRRKALGCDVEQPSESVSQSRINLRLLARLLRTVQEQDWEARACRCCTWSAMREIKGETTTVSPCIIIAGS